MTADDVARVLILAAAIPATAYWVLFVFGTRGWWKRSVGRALAVKATALMLLCDISAAYQVFGSDYPYRDAVRITVFLLVVLGLWLQLGALVHERFKASRYGRMDELMDAEEATRVYRRLAHRLLVEKDRGKSSADDS